MNQAKIGNFLKLLRNEKGLTQEQLAEKFNVSNRTVSRWETGSNMPDISLLVDLSEFYGVEVKEIIDGERKSETTNEKEIILKVAEYAETEKQKLRKGMFEMTLGITFLQVLHRFLYTTGAYGLISENVCGNIQDFIQGLTLAGLVYICLYIAGAFDKLYDKKHKKRG